MFVLIMEGVVDGKFYFVLVLVNWFFEMYQLVFYCNKIMIKDFGGFLFVKYIQKIELYLCSDMYVYVFLKINLDKC